MASTLRRKICGAGTLLGIAPLAGIATGASAQSRPETLKVGVALALSGPTAPLGQAALPERLASARVTRGGASPRGDA